VVLFAAVHMSLPGKFETSTGVSYTAAFKGNPDIGPTSFRGRV
jgi:hypothetical protein